MNPNSSWHADPDLLTGYVSGRLGRAHAASVEVPGAMRGVPCRAAIVPLAPPDRMERNLAAIVERIDRPPEHRVEALLERLGVPGVRPCEPGRPIADRAPVPPQLFARTSPRVRARALSVAAMRTRALLVVVVFALLGVGCGDDGDDGDDDGEASPDATTTEGSTVDEDGGGGDVDCAVLRDASDELGRAVQPLAQLRSMDQYGLIEDGTISLDPAAALAAIVTLRAIEDVETPATSMTVKEALDLYQEAAELAQENLAVEDPFTDAKGDELAALTAEVGFFGALTPILDALERVGCGI